MSQIPTENLKIVMMGATGAVGTETVKILVKQPGLDKLTLLGRTPFDEVSAPYITNHTVDIFSPESYTQYLPEHNCAICTLGVGQPSKMGKEEFIRIDKEAVLDFATGCRKAGIDHFQLLASVGADPDSFSFYLRIKGELIRGLQELQFKRLSIFQPSMILTPTNRYGLSQAITLKVWPLLSHLFLGPLRQYRGIEVARLGEAVAKNCFVDKSGVEMLKWDDFITLTAGAG